MRRILITMPLLIPVLAAGQVYKWVDASGKVHYSDRPVSGAETIGVPLKKAQPPQDGKATAGQASPGPYAQFEILTPEDNVTLQDAEGTVQIGLLLDPALMDGHRLQVLTDGTPVTGDVPGTQLRISGLPLGSHQLQAQILDGAGIPVASSSVVHFHLRKPASP
jgi:hypothetical protein